MKAVGYQQSLPINAIGSLMDIELPVPQAQGRDLLVRIKAIAVNPVDTKIRMRQAASGDDYVVLGWDAAGIVEAVGPDVTLFKPGDEVWYAGAVDRQGCNAEYQLVDERIAGKKPRTLSFSDAAAMPLTSLTAWELLFDRLQVSQGEHGENESILIIGGAGGVGSMLIQLASKLTKLNVIATASRPESKAWCEKLGATYVINHNADMVAQCKALGINHVDYVASLTQSEQHLAASAELLIPQGRYALIDDPQTLNINLLKRKSISLHWEFMFTRSLFNTEDVSRQHDILNAIADITDGGFLQSTATEHYGIINASNLKRAHALIESGTSIGKIVLEDFISH
jgi:zinc-binding alcohol dehydrogenase family protein